MYRTWTHNFLSTRWNGRLTWHPARRAVNSKQNCCIVSCSKQLCCWTSTLLLYRVHDMRILFYVLLQHIIWIRMIKHGENATYNTRQRTQKWGIRWVHPLACTTAVQSVADALMNFNRVKENQNHRTVVLKWLSWRQRVQLGATIYSNQVPTSRIMKIVIAK